MRISAKKMNTKSTKLKNLGNKVAKNIKNKGDEEDKKTTRMKA